MSKPSSDLGQTGRIFNIQRYCTHDGPGIRTTVFLKGCPLRCVWCHNPESTSVQTEISYIESKCIGCGACIAACPQKCHTVQDGRHVFLRENCLCCGKCVAVCPSALDTVGKTVTVEEVLAEVMEDKLFYGVGGGITLSGGEPTAQFGFTLALLRESKAQGLTTCIETCGYTTFENLATLAPYVDLFLYDYKETSPELHKKYTGVDPELVVTNLMKLDALGAKTVLRCPILPGYNDRDDHFEGIARVASTLKNIVRIDVEPGHSIGVEKCVNMGYAKQKAVDSPTKARIQEWIDYISARTSVPVRRS